MILNKEQLSMAEAQEYLDKKKESDLNVLAFIKKFTELNQKDARDMKKKLSDLGIIKMREEHMIKIVDLLPQNVEDVNKIFIGVGLDEDETKKILDTTKQFK